MGWRGDARAAIRAYPDLRRREEALHEMQITQAYGKTPGSHSASRTTEAVAVRTLPPDDQRALDAVASAISTTLRYRNGHERLQLISLVYWQRTHTLDGAALRLSVSPGTAKAWHSGFVELVDAYMRVL